MWYRSLSIRIADQTQRLEVFLGHMAADHAQQFWWKHYDGAVVYEISCWKRDLQLMGKRDEREVSSRNFSKGRTDLSLRLTGFWSVEQKGGRAR